MKAEDLKGKTQDELQKALMDTRKDQFNARLQRASGQLDNTTSMRARRRDIARIKTFMNAPKAEGTTAAPVAAKKAPAKTKSAKA